MYRQKIPLHLEQQDHLVFGLTARQVLILGCGVSLAYMLFNDLNALGASLWFFVLGIGAACFMAGGTLCAAFLQPKGRGLEQWAVILLLYLTSPRLLLWRCTEEEEEEKHHERHTAIPEGYEEW